MTTHAARPGTPPDVTGPLIAPATMGEFWIIGYLLVVGVRRPAPA